MPDDASLDELPEPAAAARLAAASYPPGVPASYPYPAVPLTRLLEDAAADFPDTPAVEAGRGRLTYAGLLEAVDRLGAALCDLGLQPGERVGVALPDSPAHLALLFAVLRVGGVVSELDPALAPATLAAQVADAGCRVLALDASVAATLSPPPGVEHLISVGVGDLLPAAGRATAAARGLRAGWRWPRRHTDGRLRLPALLAATPPAVTQARVDLARAPAVVVYPSRGEPRGAVLTHANLIAGAFQVRLWVPDVLAGQEKLLTGWPLHTALGLTAALGLGVLSAATVTVVPRPAVAPSRHPLWALLSRRRPTLLVVPPPAAVRLAAGPPRRRWDASSARVVLCGPGPVTADVLGRLETQTGARVRRVHGLPEAALTHANPVYGKAKAGSVGLPLPDTASVVVDPRDRRRVLPVGAPGRLAVSGPQVFAGWWQRPRETADAFAGPWLLTGTAATVDGDGYVRIADGPPGDGVTAAPGP